MAVASSSCFIGKKMFNDTFSKVCKTEDAVKIQNYSVMEPKIIRKGESLWWLIFLSHLASDSSTWFMSLQEVFSLVATEPCLFAEVLLNYGVRKVSFPKVLITWLILHGCRGTRRGPSYLQVLSIEQSVFLDLDQPRWMAIVQLKMTKWKQSIAPLETTKGNNVVVERRKQLCCLV